MTRVDVYLTRAEASELRDALESMLRQGPVVGWHEHVMSDDGQTEISISPDVNSW